MIDDFFISFRLRITYKTNTIIFLLKSLWPIKKLLPQSLYANTTLKFIVTIISAFFELFSIFLGKLIYLTLVFLATRLFTVPTKDSFGHLIFFLTFIGGLINTHMFSLTKDKFYAINIMRINVRNYTLSNYGYFLLKMVVGFLPFAFIFGLFSGTSIVVILAIPVLVVSVKLLFTALSLKGYRKQTKRNDSANVIQIMVVIIGLLVVAFLPPALGYVINNQVFIILTILLLIPGIFSLKYILNFKEYRKVYKELLKPKHYSAGVTKQAGIVQQMAMQKKISVNTSLVSDKTGYQYFNELFMKRHSKLLIKPAFRITIISFIVLITLIIICLFDSTTKAVVNRLILTYLPYFLFIMYLVNRGKGITQAMFMNCDHSMLVYRFYRQPKAVLLLFIERLKHIIIINLIPASVIALGLPLLLYLTGGTEQTLNYLLLFTSIIAMSIFFSVHNIVMYYLLQPYNVNLETKNFAYGIVNFITYFVCYYIATSLSISTLIFGSVISLFCLFYIVVALILAYKLAPRTFKLRL